MCGRYELHTRTSEIARRFDAQLIESMQESAPRYNVAPSTAVPVVREGRHGRVLEPMSWGLVPGWCKDLSGPKPINARVETVFDKPMFRSGIRRRRCLIPADGFYEWKAGGARKQPYWIGMADHALFAFAGIWEYWAKEGADPLISCAIVVGEANALICAIHDRMPVIVAPEDYARWLDPALDAREAIEPMLRPYPAELMRAYPVGTRVNDVRNDDAALLDPVPVG